MKWKPGKRSGDIEDRRGAGGGFGGGGMPIPMGRLGGGIGTLIVFAIVYFLFVQGGGGGGFNVPEPTNSFPQVPATGTGGNSVPGSPDEDRGAVRRLRPSRRPGLLDEAVPGGGKAVSAGEGRGLPGSGPVGLRPRQLRDRAVLLPAPSQGLPRSRLLRRAEPALQGSRRLRPSLRRRPRAGPPRPAAARHRGERPPPEPVEPRRRKRALRAPRAPGRLPGRGLGAVDL